MRASSIGRWTDFTVAVTHSIRRTCENGCVILCLAMWDPFVRAMLVTLESLSTGSSCIYSALLVCVCECVIHCWSLLFLLISHSGVCVCVCVCDLDTHSCQHAACCGLLSDNVFIFLTAHSQLQFAHFDILLVCVCFLSPYVLIVYGHWATRWCILYVYVFAQHGFPCYCRSVMCACSCSRGPLTSLV